MSTDAIFKVGEHVWWGDPAAPHDGWIVAFATLPELVYVKYKPPYSCRGERPTYAALTVSQLRPFCPICGKHLDIGELCPVCNPSRKHVIVT